MNADSTSKSVRVRNTRRRWHAPDPILLICLAILAITAVVVVLGGAVAPQSPSDINPALGATGPTSGHTLGTDQLGRDILSRLIVGARSAVLGALVVAIGTTTIGTVVGLLAGYRRGRLDTLLMRSADVVYAFPFLLTTLVVVGVYGGGIEIAVAILILFAWPIEARLVRSVTLVQSSLPYVEAAKTLNLSEPRIIFRHVLPNVLPTVIADILVGFVGALGALAGLAFLGLGVQPGSPNWGLMISDNRGILDLNVWGALAPSLALVLVSLAATVAADSWYSKISNAGGVE